MYIPFRLLKAWHEFLRLQNKERDKIVGESQDHPGLLLTSSGTLHISQGIKEITYDYVDLFQYCIPGHTFAITDDEQIRAEVNKTLAKIAGMVQTSYREDIIYGKTVTRIFKQRPSNYLKKCRHQFKTRKKNC